jgi:PKHD-type hydroxylase
VHYVAPVTRGARLGAVFWIQSLVRDHERRTLLFEISQVLSVLQQERGQMSEIVRLTACYHRLVQMWAQPLVLGIRYSPICSSIPRLRA